MAASGVVWPCVLSSDTVWAAVGGPSSAAKVALWFDRADSRRSRPPVPSSYIYYHMATPTPVLIYDGRCRFCVAQAQRLQRWTRGRVRLESFRDPGVIARYPGLTPEQCEQAVQLVEPDGRISGGAEAIARTLRLNPAFVPLSWLYHLPVLRQAADRLYALVARNRFRLRAATCLDDACRLHHGR